MTSVPSDGAPLPTSAEACQGDRIEMARSSRVFLCMLRSELMEERCLAFG